MQARHSFLILAMAVPVLAGAQNVPGDFGMFLPVAELDTAGLAARSLNDDSIVIRARRVNIDTSALMPLTDVLDRGAALPVLRLNLFQNVVIGAMVESVDLTASGYSWSGAVAGDPLGSVAMAVNGDVVSGTIRTQGRVYLIQHDGAGLHSIREVDQSRLPEGAPPVVSRTTARTEPRAFVDDPDRVDIAVFYTPQALEDAGGEREIHALIDAWIADTNGAYLRSGIYHRLNLVLSEEVDYTEGDDSDEDNDVTNQALSCLEDEDDGCLDGIHDRRNQYSADLVHLVIAGAPPEHFCGMALTPGSFGVTHLNCGSNTFAHEIGHNSGVQHDRYLVYDACDDPPCFGSWLPEYAYGYVNQLGLNRGAQWERRWRTVMSYHDQCRDAGVGCRQIMLFSNPDLSWYGDRLGVPGSRRTTYRNATDAARRGPSDAVRTHNEFAFDLANRRARVTPDLIVTGHRATPPHAAPSEYVVMSAVVENLGILTGPFETSVSWCLVTTRTCRPTGVVVSVPPLETNGRAAVSTWLKMPSRRGAAVYRACVSTTAGEILTENNCSEDVTIDVGTLDLRVSLSLSRNSVRPGEPITVRGTARNYGTLDVGVGVVILSVRDLEGEWDRFRRYLFPGLRPGQSASVEERIEAPSTPGDYPYNACLWSPQVEWNCAVEWLTVTP